MTAISWPASPAEYQALAQDLAELVGGRTDVAARFHDFEAEPGRRVKGWGPWKGRRVSKDYKALPGELVQGFKNYKKPGEYEFRVLNPLSPANLVEHLRGRERLGVYVLDATAHCQFLAADFDDHAGLLDPAAVWAEVHRFVETCEGHDWRVHVERSKSGKGYHVWLFFDAPVEAAKARAVGRWLMEESQTIREGEDFSTFDRFFPAQSVVPPAGKGYGNLIGLPLCGGKEYAAGRTAWVDRASGELLPDAMGTTRGILEHGRNTAARVEAFLAEWAIKPEEAEAYHGAVRDPNIKLGTVDEFDAMRSRCKFINWATDPGAWPHEWPGQGVSEPLWFAWLSNLARFENGQAYAHEANAWHPKYSAPETDFKIEHARCSSGPYRCEQIRKEGFKRCPEGGCKLPSGKPTKAPAGLAIWGQPREPGPKRDRTVRIEDPSAVSAPVEPDQHSRSDGPATPWRRDIALYPDTGMPWPAPVGGFVVTDEGVRDHSNAFIAIKPLWVDALTRDYSGRWGISIKFFDHDWKLKTHAIPRERLHEQGGTLGKELASLGFPLLPGKEKWVSRYLVLQEGGIERRIRAAGRLGWFDAPESPAVFVLPDQVLGKTPEEIVYQPDVVMPAAETLHGQGTLRDWQKLVVDPCSGNPVLMFAIMMGLAGPLLKLCQEQSGGFHLYGVTTAGKTTAAQLAASVWGCAADPQEGPEVTSLRKWYTTGNALESLAEVHNDMLLTLDEISEVDPHELGRVIYQLAGGLSKGRANAGGGMRVMRAWRLLFFSTGEKSVRQMLAGVGQTEKGGQRVRLPDIPADHEDDGRRAIVMDAHGRDPKDFVQDLKAACARHYGLAGPVFVAWLIAEAERKGLHELARQLREDLRGIEAMLAEGIEDRLPPEGRRVLRRFALVALAGIWAQAAGVTAWQLPEILEAVKNVRDRWLGDQGQEVSEVDRALAYLRNQLIRGADRFRWIDASGHARTSGRELLGFRTAEYYLLTEEGLRELCGEHDTRAVLRALKMAGQLWHDKDRLTRKSPRIEEFGDSRPNLYWIHIGFMGEQVVGDSDEDLEIAGRAAVEVSGETRRPGGRREQDDIPF